MTYSVKELFYTLQGEGTNMGRPAVFCRFTGCNLWSGREEDRSSARCCFCDTNFVGTDGLGGGKFLSPESLAQAARLLWPDCDPSNILRPFIVCTGGEPLLQLDADLVCALHEAGFDVAVETNGTIPAPDGIDWTCVSPKAGTVMELKCGDELKLVFPQPGISPEQFEELEFRNFFLQPMDGSEAARNTRLAVEYCLAHPRWRLSLQTHKFLGIP